MCVVASLPYLWWMPLINECVSVCAWNYNSLDEWQTTQNELSNDVWRRKATEKHRTLYSRILLWTFNAQSNHIFSATRWNASKTFIWLVVIVAANRGDGDGGDAAAATIGLVIGVSFIRCDLIFCCDAIDIALADITYSKHIVQIGNLQNIWQTRAK